MTEQHQGIIQAAINSELYETRTFCSQVTPYTQIFVIRGQDREVLINKGLKQTQRLYEKNQQGQITSMKSIGDALKEPAQSLAESTTKLNALEGKQLASQADVLVRLVDEIQLVNMLADDSWKSETELFSVQDSIDEVVSSVLSATKRKGLQLLINNHLEAYDVHRDDRDVLRRILLLLMQCVVTSTQLGKITLEVDQDESSEDRLMFRILSTGESVSIHEMNDLHLPFINQTQNDHYGKADPPTSRLSDQLAHKLGGHSNIKAWDGFDVRYSVHTKMLATNPEVEEKKERLLDGVCVTVDITSTEIRNIVTRQLEN